MFSVRDLFRCGAAALVTASAALQATPAFADGAFPFGLEMTLDVARQPGSKRLPSLEIGDNGEAVLELWCKGGRGQFAVAGNTVIFAAGPLEDRACPPTRAQADDDLVAALSATATWKRQGDFVSFTGTKPLRFRPTETSPAAYFQTDLLESQRWPLNSLASASTEPLSSFCSPSSSPLDSSAKLNFAPAASSAVEITGLPIHSISRS